MKVWVSFWVLGCLFCGQGLTAGFAGLLRHEQVGTVWKFSQFAGKSKNNGRGPCGDRRFEIPQIYNNLKHRHSKRCTRVSSKHSRKWGLFQMFSRRMLARTATERWLHSILEKISIWAKLFCAYFLKKTHKTSHISKSNYSSKKLLSIVLRLWPGRKLQKHSKALKISKLGYIV